jgi:LPXTG-motif cell wall-anchored protein
MFSIFGVLITVFGLFTASDSIMYQRSLGINVNIIMGIIMLVFGFGLLLFVRKKKKK